MVGIAPLPAAQGVPQFLGSSANAGDIRKLVLKVFSGGDATGGVHRQASIALPPFAGNLVLRGVRPGRKLVTVDALDGSGGALFTGALLSTQPGPTPDIRVQGRLLLGGAGARATLKRLSGRTPGARIRIENSRGSLVTNTEFRSVSGTAVELSNAAATISSSVFTDAAQGVVAVGSSPIVVGGVFGKNPLGISLTRSTALVQGNRFTDTTTAVTAADSSLIAVANVVIASTAAVRHGIRIQRTAATLSQNRLSGVTGTADSFGRVTKGLDQGIVVVDSVAGTASVSSRVEIDHNTVQGAATAGMISIASDPIFSFNRVLGGRGTAAAGAVGIAVNQASSTFPKQPLLLSNEIVDNDGPGVAFLTEADKQPGGGGVLGNAGRDGNFVRGNNSVNLGFTPGVDIAIAGTVDGVFQTRTFQVFGVDAILAAAAAPIAGAGAPDSVR
ncbi:MAG: right-handed parallel beta-helix repeat-containing protein [Candidatus Wallbacteria bacterium]|nr:right-handed parallel beta-helix repeat-containing protein [Candidatus Wallbacteria bacterium]